MLIRFPKLVRGVPGSKVFEWCTDYQSFDAQVSNVRLRSRNVLKRTAEAVWLEDRGKIVLPFDSKVTVKLHPPDRWEADSALSFGTSHNEYRVTEVPDGTRLDISLDITIHGMKRLLSTPLKPYVQRQIEKEWDDYVRAMEREIT
jgi:hypothetical protein